MVVDGIIWRRRARCRDGIVARGRGGGAGGGYRGLRGQAGCVVPIDKTTISSRQGGQRAAVRDGGVIGGDGQGSRFNVQGVSPRTRNRENQRTGYGRNGEGKRSGPGWDPGQLPVGSKG